jgi:MFS family permease
MALAAVVLLDGATVAVLLPRLQDGLSLSVVELQWVVNAAAITWAVTLIPAGWRADRIGHRRNVRQGLVPLALGSACAAAAPNFAVLTVGRVGQGVGAAMTTPSVIALLTQAAAGTARGQTLGRFASVLGALELLCPVVGGLLVVTLGWRAVFVTGVLLSGMSWVAIRGQAAQAPASAPAATDWTGAVLLAAVILALVLGTIQINSSGIGSVPTLALFAAAAAGTVALVLSERRSSAPVLDLSLLRSVEFSAMLGLLFVVFFAIGVYFFFITIYLQRALHMSPLLAAAGLVPVSAFTILLSARIGRAGDRTSHHALVAAGLLAFTAGLLLTIPGVHSVTYAAMLPAIVALGVGLALLRAPLLSLVNLAGTDRQAGARNASAELIGRLGGVMGVAIGVTIFLSVSTADLNTKLPGAGLEYHFTAAKLRSMWNHPAPVEAKYHELPAATREQVRHIVKDTGTDALATTLYPCAALVGGVGLVLIGVAARRSRAPSGSSAVG